MQKILCIYSQGAKGPCHLTFILGGPRLGNWVKRVSDSELSQRLARIGSRQLA